MRLNKLFTQKPFDHGLCHNPTSNECNSCIGEHRLSHQRRCSESIAWQYLNRKLKPRCALPVLAKDITQKAQSVALALHVFVNQSNIQRSRPKAEMALNGAQIS